MWLFLVSPEGTANHPASTEYPSSFVLTGFHPHVPSNKRSLVLLYRIRFPIELVLRQRQRI
jgi:hypothetical protein